ncbi:MAG: hypothetical protein GJ680_07415 [Alteromonadaceae bacterium]|nr:hypothetical protein [Alteromonadaceae bacterium]
MNKDPNVYRMPKRINDPLTIIIFPAVQILPSLAVFGAGMVFGISLYATPVAIMWFFVCGQILKTSEITDVIHKLWMWGVLDSAIKPSKTVVNPLIRRYFS